jgi:AcrR family transcriptional regulator
MAKARRSTKRFADSKAAVVAAAINVLNRKGASRMTLADVADRLGLSAPSITYYFGKKEDLAAACLMQGLSRFDDFICEAESASTVRERLERLLSAYFAFRARGALGEVEELPTFGDARGLNLDAVYVPYGAMFRRLRALLTGAGAPPLARPALNSAAHLLLTQLHWTPVWFRNVYPEDTARFGERLFNVLADGLAAPGADWTPAKIPDVLPELEPTDGASIELFLRAASAQINEQGYRGTSVDKIAARLNLTKGSFYHHIKTKDELVLACFERTFDVMRRTILAAEAVSTTGLQTLATIAATLVEHQIAGDVPLLRASAVNTVLESSQAIIQAGIERISTRIASVISDGIADGSVRKIDANVGAHMIMAMINNADELQYFARGISPADALDVYVRPLFMGLLTRADEGANERPSQFRSDARSVNVDSI